ncbi:hypothetical protein [Streptacidiphilus sp. MAP5-3]|uniref:hypothetical protein n=1 Tax=unclassified Streptacidiphilus TaxID=2643834 RepID=UPI003518C75B
MIALHLPGPASAALLVTALLACADHTADQAEAARCRNLADQIGDGLDQLPTPHQLTGDPT